MHLLHTSSDSEYSQIKTWYRDDKYKKKVSDRQGFDFGNF